MELRCAHLVAYVAPGLSSLALPAPVCDPVGIALAARRDRGAAARARTPGLPVDRALPEPGVERAAHQLRGLGQRRAKLLLGDVRSFATGRSRPARAPRPARGCRSRRPAADRGAPRRSPLRSAPRSLRASRRGRAGRRGCPARGCGPASSSSSTGPFQSTASVLSPRSTSHGVRAACSPVALEELPAPLHAQMAAQHEPVLEAQQEVLADRLDPQQPPAVEALGDAGHPGARMRRLDLEPLPDERLEPRAARWSESPSGILEAYASTLESSSGRRGRDARLGGARADRPAALPPGLLRCRRARQGVHAGPGWRPLGLAIHAPNGASSGSRSTRSQSRRRGSAPACAPMALVEHVTLFSTGTLADRYHPARESRECERVFSPPAFGQATLRHAVFGLSSGLAN